MHGYAPSLYSRDSGNLSPTAAPAPPMRGQVIA